MNTVTATSDKTPAAISIALALSAIKPSPTNPRQHFEKDGLAEMAESIKVHGVLQPVLVRQLKGDSYELVVGERRFRASKLAGKDDIPAIVRTLSDKQVLEIQVIENLQRKDLHALEEADGYAKLIKSHGYTAQEIADKIGMSKAYVHTRLQLAVLSPECRKLFYAEKLTPTTALLVARIPVPELRDKAAKEIAGGRYQGSPPLSARDAIRHVQENYMLALSDAPFPTGDEALVPGCGSCRACPKRTGNQPELFGDVKGKDVCTDPVCFSAKRTAHMARQKAEAAANGVDVISGPEAKKIKPYQHSDLDGGWIDLNRKCYEDSKNRTYRQLLGKGAPKVSLLECPHTHALIEIIRRTDATDALKAKGVKLQSNGGSSGRVSNAHRAKQRALEAKAKLETAVRCAVLDGIRPKIGNDLVVGDEIMITLALFEGIGFDNQKVVCDRWGWTEQFKKSRKPKDEMTGLSTTDRHRFMIECALAGEARVNHWSVERSDFKATAMAAVATRHNVNHAKIRTTVVTADQLKQKGKAKPKREQRKGSKATKK